MRKKKFKNVLVVLGGTSGERNISLKSGKACISALKKKKYRVLKFDPKFDDFKKIDKDKIDVIFNALHGRDGEDGVAQSYFEYLKIPYTHSGVISSYNSMDKIISKRIFDKFKILNPKYFEIHKTNFKVKIFKNFLKKKKIFYPIVIKPINEGSSLGVKICFNLIQTTNSIKKLFKKYDRLLIEQYIGGQEIQAAVLNTKPIGAIELVPKRSFYDYKAKYSKSAKTKHIMPAKLDKKKYREVLSISKRAHLILNCRGVTRSDFKFYKNKFYLLEINTQPGMTNLSLVPEIAAFVGIDFPNLVEKILFDASINK